MYKGTNAFGCLDRQDKRLKGLQEEVERIRLKEVREKETECLIVNAVLIPDAQCSAPLPLISSA